MQHYVVTRQCLGVPDPVRFRIAAERPGLASATADLLKLAVERHTVKAHQGLALDQDLLRAASTYLL